MSIVARRHNVNANLVFTWRKQHQQGTLVDSTEGDGKSGLASACPHPGRRGRSYWYASAASGDREGDVVTGERPPYGHDRNYASQRD